MATTILAAGVSMAAGLALSSGRARAVAQHQGLATVLARSKIEQIRSLAWTRGADSSEVSDRSTNVAAPPVTSGGAGLTVSPGSTLDESVSGYCDYLDALGSWVGEGPRAPPSAAWVRRWAVGVLTSDTPDVLRIEVSVEPLYVSMQQPRGASRREGARLVAMRARRAL